MSYTDAAGNSYVWKPTDDNDPTSVPTPPDGTYMARCDVTARADKNGNPQVILEWEMVECPDGAEKWAGRSKADFFTFFESTHPNRARESRKLKDLCNGLKIAAPPAPRGRDGEFDEFIASLQGNVFQVELKTTDRGFQNVIYASSAQ